MPKTKSAKKRMRQTIRRMAHNRSQRSALRTAIRKVRDAATREEALAAFRTAMRLLDRAARKYLIHKNTAARYKSRLSKIVSAKS